MATIINTTPAAQGQRDSTNGMGFLVGIILLIIFGVLFFVYGIPALTRSMQGSTPDINVPDQIDVNVNQGQPQQ